MLTRRSNDVESDDELTDTADSSSYCKGSLRKLDNWDDAIHIWVPVGMATLSHIINVIGEPIEHRDEIIMGIQQWWKTHREDAKKTEASCCLTFINFHFIF
ncbi:hypothetical protein L1987_29344 [Smallanthus sonchifolius]|uniref:Uncharacterized protein n=1 Tax=Smallanthus sonchifolius TaxID=185202 RepID=A0ACB9HZR5_9ASTR|nr:hypothetical protein L1987_29344 [Smallanthus sonchifolius]